MLPRRDVRASTGLHARIAVVQISMTMPVMEPELDAAVLRDWARAIDDGPFASLCWGERMAFDNPETLTLMGALAAWTDRVRLVTTVIVPQLSAMYGYRFRMASTSTFLNRRYNSVVSQYVASTSWSTICQRPSHGCARRADPTSDVRRCLAGGVVQIPIHYWLLSGCKRRKRLRYNGFRVIPVVAEVGRGAADSTDQKSMGPRCALNVKSARSLRPAPPGIVTHPPNPQVGQRLSRWSVLVTHSPRMCIVGCAASTFDGQR
jgi:hypothetical protein